MHTPFQHAEVQFEISGFRGLRLPFVQFPNSVHRKVSPNSQSEIVIIKTSMVIVLESRHYAPMKRLTRTIGPILLILILLVRVSGRGAEQTWTGEISDSHCRAEHEPLAEDAPVLPSPECVKLCLKSAYKYVIVVGENVYSITNQDQPDLAKFAGQAVKLTGDLQGQAITVTRIEAAR